MFNRRPTATSVPIAGREVPHARAGRRPGLSDGHLVHGLHIRLRPRHRTKNSGGSLSVRGALGRIRLLDLISDLRVLRACLGGHHFTCINLLRQLHPGRVKQALAGL
jgi:hypothetical protein